MVGRFFSRRKGTAEVRQARHGHSIFVHIQTHIRPDGPGLLPGGESLPDEDADWTKTPGGLRWAPGAFEGVDAHHGLKYDARESKEVGGRIYKEILRLPRRPTEKDEDLLAGLLRQVDMRRVMDSVLEMLNANPPRNPRVLYEAMKSLLLTSGRRDVVKLSMAVVATFRNKQNIPLFHTVGRHEEFTLYAAVALSRVCDDPIPELLTLARNVEGWGRVELVEKLLTDPRRDVCDFLLGEGYRNKVAYGYTALAIAEGCHLATVFEGGRLDEGLMRGAAGILGTLADDAYGGPDGGMLDFKEGPRTTERCLSVFAPLARTPEDFLSIHSIRDFAIGRDNDKDEEEKLLAAGWTKESRTRIAEQCDQILRRPEWKDRTIAAFESNDEKERWIAPTLAHMLGLRDELLKQVQRRPLDGLMWFYLSRGATEEQMKVVLDLARRLLDIPSIATGRSDSHRGGPGFETHSCVEHIVQELRRFPGLGWDFIRYSLQSPVIRNRTMAMQALAAWGPENLTPDMLKMVREGLTDPSKYVRADCEELLARVEKASRRVS